MTNHMTVEKLWKLQKTGNIIYLTNEIKYMICKITHLINSRINLFMTWCVVKIYGSIQSSIQSRLSKEMWKICESQLIASQRMFDIEWLHKKRGYEYFGMLYPEHYNLTPEVL